MTVQELLDEIIRLSELIMIYGEEDEIRTCSNTLEHQADILDKSIEVIKESCKYEFETMEDIEELYKTNKEFKEYVDKVREFCRR